MATVKEHLRKVHETFAEHHRAMSKHHSAAMGKESDQKEFHKAAAAAHDAAADAHESMCNECAKAIESDLNKLIPTAISGVTPTGHASWPFHDTGSRNLPCLSCRNLRKYSGCRSDPEPENLWKVDWEPNDVRLRRQDLTSCFQCQPRLQGLVDAVRAWRPAPLFTFAQSCETHLGRLRTPYAHDSPGE